MKLNFKKVGDTGPAVIILHGVFGFLDNWLTISKHIADAGFTLYLIDQRNHGRSPHEAHMNFDLFSDDLSEFISDQKLDAPFLVGHSMGGKTVMQYAVNYPKKLSKLVIVDIGPKEYPMHHSKILEGLNALDLSKITSRQNADDLLASFEPIMAVRQFLLKNLYRTESGAFNWRFNLPVLTSDIQNIGKKIESIEPVNAPALFIRGSKSNYILNNDWDQILELFPNAKLETIQNSGHWIQAEQPKAFLDALLPFLKEK